MTQYIVEGFHQHRGWETVYSRQKLERCRGFVDGVQRWRPVPKMRIVIVVDGKRREIIEEWGVME